jgi:predicted dehydrogenase
MEKKINWGILGTGNIANKFAEALGYTDQTRLLAVGSRSIDNAKVFAEKFGIPKFYGSYEELANDSEVDVIYVATPHVFHLENTLLCLNKGKAVLCEKPFAINQNQVQQMIDTARRKNLFLMEALWTRFIPTIDKTIEIINSGAIGEVKYITSDFGFKPPVNPAGRLYNPDLGGGSLLDIGIYPVFIALLLLGVPDDVKAIARKTDQGIDETISMIFDYHSGQQASLFSTIKAPTNVETEIFGTLGKITLKRKWHNPTWLSIIMNDESQEEITFDYKSNGYEWEAQEVTNCLLEGKTQSERMNWDFSLKLISLLDRIREICGIRYKEDK